MGCDRGVRRIRRAGGLRALVLLACAAEVFGAVSVRAEDPWIVTDHVAIHQATERVGDIVVVTGGRLEVSGVPEPGFRLTGSLLVVGSGEVVMDASVVRIMSAYHGQYFVAATENGKITVRGCDYRIPSGVQHAIIAFGDSTVTVTDTEFNFVQLLASGRGSLTAERLNGQFEVLLQQSAQLTLRDIPRDPGEGLLWVWPEFTAGSKAVYSPPMPGFVAGWSFPPVGATGFTQSCTLERCEVKLWPFLIQPGSDLTVRDVPEANWVVIGLHMPNDALVDGLRNGLYYAGYEVGFTDRRLVLENASVDTWNFYPQAAATVRFRDCLLGEILAMEHSHVVLERSTIDGSGGYFGVEGNATVEAIDSVFTCDVQVSDDGTASFRRSRLLPYPFDASGSYTHFSAHDTGRLLLDASEATSTPLVGGSGVIAVAGVANPPAAPPASGENVDLFGWAALFGADPVLTPLQWRLEAVAQGEAPVLLNSGEGNVEGGPLGSWSGADPRRSWELRIVLRDGYGRELVSRSQVAAVPRARRRSAGGR